MTQWGLSKRFQHPSGSIAYERFGEDPGLVFIHGSPSSSFLWRNVVKTFGPGISAVCYDLLGYGQSEKRADQDVSIPAQARLLVELLGHWGIERPVLVGHDYGAAIALHAHLDAKVEIAGLILVDAGAVPPADSPFSNHVRSWPEAYRSMPEYVLEWVIRSNVRTAIAGTASDSVLDGYVAPWLGDAGRDGYVRMLEHYRSEDVTALQPLYSNISVPTLILWGELDTWLPLSDGEMLRQLIPNATGRTIENAGHFAPEDAPEEIADAITEFLRGIGLVAH